MSVATLDPELRSVLAQVRREAPLVQCLTNHVVSNVTANALLALGASAAMVDVPEEAGPFAAVASGVLVNLGTPHADQRAAIVEAAEAAHAAGTPWVLDPVAVGPLPVRTKLAHELLELRPTVIRGNPSEILALAGQGDGGRGVDTAAGVEEAAGTATALARDLGCVVAVSGPVDLVTDGDTGLRLDRGHPWLTTMTGGGCALGAVVAAVCGVHDDPLTATAAAVAGWGFAAEQAAARATGPGSFAVALLDALATL